MRLRKGNTIIKVSYVGNPERHPDADKGLAFGKRTTKRNNAYRNAICEDCGAQDKWVRDNRCLSKIDCIYRQRSWELTGIARPYWYSHTTDSYNGVIHSMVKFLIDNRIKLTDEELDRQMEFLKERFGG